MDKRNLGAELGGELPRQGCHLGSCHRRWGRRRSLWVLPWSAVFGIATILSGGSGSAPPAVGDPPKE